MEILTNPDAWIALLTLTTLEVVLGIDNVIFISIICEKLPPAKRQRGRTIGLLLAMGMRVALLLSLTWIMSLTTPIISIAGGISGRDIILIAGGLFLIAKSTFEIHERLEGKGDEVGVQKKSASFASTMLQIILIDVVFSLDSIITAIGMTQTLWVMIAAIIIAVLIMMASAKMVSDFIHGHPTLKILALSFLLLIGITLIAEGFDQQISKGYIYFAMAFSVFIEMLNIRLRKISGKPVMLRELTDADVSHPSLRQRS